MLEYETRDAPGGCEAGYAKDMTRMRGVMRDLLPLARSYNCTVTYNKFGEWMTGVLFLRH